MKKQRLVSLVLLLAMALFALSGCQKSGAASSAGDESKGPVPLGDPVKISIGSTFEFQTTPCQWYETEIYREITKAANVTIDSYVYYDQDKFNILLAGSDMPDLIISYYPAKLQDIIESKMALDLKPYLNTYPNLDGEAFQQSNRNISNYFGGKDNALYFLGDCIGVELRGAGVKNLRGYSVRWDYYKEIGAPEIKNRDDYIAVLEAMVAAHPTTPDGKKMYATGIAGAAFDQWYLNGCFVKPGLMDYGTFSGYLYMAGFDDNILYDAYTNTQRSCYWSDMEFYNILYNKGLLDPDSFTMTFEQRQAKSASGIYVAEMCWPNDDLYLAEKNKDPDTLAGMIIVPNEASIVYGNYKHDIAGYFPWYAIWVSAKSQAVDGALSFLNVLRDPDVTRMMQSGIEGVHWNMVNGVPTPTDEILSLRMEGGDAWKKIGIDAASSWQMLQSGTLAEDGFPLNLFDTDEMRRAGLNPVEKDVADYYQVDYPAQANMKLVESKKAVDLSNYLDVAGFVGAIPMDIQRILTQCNDILLQAVPKLVQAKTDDEFRRLQAQVLGELKDAGEDTAWTWAEDAFAKAKALVE